MNLWLDAHLPPSICGWVSSTFGLRARSIIEAGLRDSDDGSIFNALAVPGTVLMTKDEDFVARVHARGAPPQVLWVRSGNISETALRDLLIATLPKALEMLRAGEAIVEISD